MKPRASISILCAGFVAVAAAVRAQEFSVFAGAVNSPQSGDESAAWQVDYRQNFGRHVAWSLSWLNEGHVPDHHRDGPAAQVWGVLPSRSERFAFSFGAGAYCYFDTQPAAGGDSHNVHGWAPLVSAAVTCYTTSPWFFQLRANRVAPPDNLAVDTVNIGAGYSFEARYAPWRLAAGPAGVPERTTENELTFSGGQTVVNTPLTGYATATSAEYRRGVGRHLDWTVAWLNEGDPDVVRRCGVATQIWIAGAYLEERIALSLGFGAYVYVDHQRPEHESQATIAALISPSVAYRFSETWLVRLTWHRVVSKYDRDSDVFLIGAGFRWGR